MEDKMGVPTEDLPLFRPEAIQAADSRLGAPVRPVGVASWVVTLFLVCLFCALAIFISTAHYARKETVQGELEPSSGALRITSVKPGVVREVFVHEGQNVAAGTPLISVTLDPVVEGGAPLGTLLRAADATETQALAQQNSAHQQSVQDQLRELATKRDALLILERRLSSELDLQSARLKLQQQTLDGMEELHRQKFIAEVQYRQQQEAVVSAQQALSAIQKQQEDSAASLKELVEQERRLGDDAAETRAQVKSSQAQLQEKAANLSADSQIILTAPKAGRVVALQAKPGTSISNSAALAVILPEGAVLEANLWAPSRAAGFVRPGDEVRLMYDAFPYERFGVGHGRVIEVSKAPVPPNELPVNLDTREALYRVTVALDRQDMKAYDSVWPLAPGMRLNADLVLESRTFLEWLLDPINAIRRRG